MGFLDDAGVEVNEIPDDPFGFGNDFWPVRIVEIKDPKLTTGGDKYGMMVKWAVDHEKYQSHFVAQGLGNGNWLQLPVPKVLQEQGVPWDPKNDEKHATVLYNLRKLFEALGFRADEMSKVGKDEMLGRGCLAKIRPTMDENGFWQFRLVAMKPFASGGGAAEFTKEGTSNPNGGLSPEDLLKRELEGN